MSVDGTTQRLTPSWRWASCAACSAVSPSAGMHGTDMGVAQPAPGPDEYLPERQAAFMRLAPPCCFSAYATAASRTHSPSV